MLFHPALMGIAKAIQRQIEHANNSAHGIVINVLYFRPQISEGLC